MRGVLASDHSFELKKALLQVRASSEGGWLTYIYIYINIYTLYTQHQDGVRKTQGSYVNLCTYLFAFLLLYLFFYYIYVFILSPPPRPS